MGRINTYGLPMTFFKLKAKAKDTEPAETGPGKSVFFSAPDGLKLHAVEYGGENGDALPVICLAGLSRNSRDFERLAIFLSEKAAPTRRVICFDYRGRGLSVHDPDWKNYNVITEAEDVLAGMTALGIAHAASIGTSRGGLIAMALSAMRPGALKAVILNDVGPVIEGDGLATIRAMLTQLPKPKNWDEAIAIQKTAMGKAFPAFSQEDWAFEAHAKYRQIGRKIRPDHDPDLVKPLAEIDLGEKLPEMWPQFIGLTKTPVLLLRGEHSGLLSKKTVEAMSARHPDMQVMEIAGQGHPPLLHKDGIPEAIERFLGGVAD